MLSIMLGLEFLSLLSYLYISFDIKNSSNAESSTKYIVFGLFATAVMLYGITFLYGLSGSLYLDAGFLSELSKAEPAMVAMAIILFAAGFLFKISAAPFHYYSPDVYEGSQPSTLAFISTLPKIAGFAVLYLFINRFHFQYQGSTLIWPHFNWEKVLAIIAIVTMFVGNLSALAQQNLKRIFAYSSISHTGFLLMGLVVFSSTGLDALFYYLLIYVISNFALFFILQYAESKYGIKELSQFVGFGKKEKFLSGLLVVLLASFTGLPPLAGFLAKFFVFSGVFEQYQVSHEPWLLFVLIAGVLNTVIALFYYFNIARVVFLKPGEFSISAITILKNENLLIFLISILCLSLIYLGLQPFLVTSH
jgi:NADH-quinone oxidoreductase subunit N